MFTVPQPNTKFMESLIFTLYNFGSNQREEFLLIKLFRLVTSSSLVPHLHALQLWEQPEGGVPPYQTLQVGHQQSSIGYGLV